MQRTAKKQEERNKSDYQDNITASLYTQAMDECQSKSTLMTYAGSAAEQVSNYVADAWRRIFRKVDTGNQQESPAAEFDSTHIIAIENEIKALQKNKKDVNAKITAAKKNGAQPDNTLLQTSHQIKQQFITLDTRLLLEKLKKRDYKIAGYMTEHQKLQPERYAYLTTKKKIAQEARELVKSTPTLTPIKRQGADIRRLSKRCLALTDHLKSLKQQKISPDPKLIETETKLTTLVKQLSDNQKLHRPVKARYLYTGRKIARYNKKKFDAELQLLENEIKLLKLEKKLVDDQVDLNKKQNVEPDPKLVNKQLELLENMDDILIKKVELSAPMIRAHATMRVDLFFLLAIAIYNKQVSVKRGSTDRQHGKGSGLTGTAACHVSIIPNVVVAPLNHDDKKSVSALSLLNKVSNFFASATKPTTAFTLTGTYLEDTLNLTNELIDIVNKFNCHMEGIFGASNAIKECIKTLNRCAAGEINPIDALQEYGKVMGLFYQHMEYKYVLSEIKYSNSGEIASPKAFKLVWQHERAGYLCAFDLKTSQPKWEYIYTLLNLPAAKRTASYVYSGYISAKILELQAEILANKSNFVMRNVNL